MNDILNAQQTAKVIGCSSKKVCERLKRKLWKFGKAVSPKESGAEKYQYEVKKADLADYLNIDICEVERRLEGGDKNAV